MHKCEFCFKSFIPRPQVKRPRACKYCQKQRQRDNEKAWRERNSGIYDSSYHQAQKQKRQEIISVVVCKALECFRAGIYLHGHEVNWEFLEGHLQDLFIRLGVRQINKLWALKTCTIAVT